MLLPRLQHDAKGFYEEALYRFFFSFEHDASHYGMLILRKSAATVHKIPWHSSSRRRYVVIPSVSHRSISQLPRSMPRRSRPDFENLGFHLPLVLALMCACARLHTGGRYGISGVFGQLQDELDPLGTHGPVGTKSLWTAASFVPESARIKRSSPI